MANALYGNPIKLDTISGSLTGHYSIRSVHWVSTSASEIADNDDIVLTNTAGGEIFVRRAGAADDGYKWEFHASPFKADGIYNNTHDGGVVFIYLF